MAIYAQDLSKYDLEPVAAALERLGLSKRADREMALPEVGDLIERVGSEIRAQQTAPMQEAAEKWLAYLDAAKAEGVTEPDTEILTKIDELNKKHGLKGIGGRHRKKNDPYLTRVAEASCAAR